MSVSMQQIQNEVRQQQWNAAEIHLKQGLQEHPNSAKGWYYLAQVEDKLNHSSEAQSALEHANSIDPSHSFAGNIAIYNQLEARLNRAETTVFQEAPQHTATVQHQTYQAQTSPMPMIVGAGVTIAIILIVVWLFKRSNKKTAVEQLRDDLGIKYKPKTSEASARQTPVTVPKAAPYVPRTSYLSDPPGVSSSHTHSRTSDFASGMLTGVLADEAISGLTGRYDHHKSEPSFDYGSSSSSSSSSSFDYGSSSSSWSSDSSSSFDSGSSFDFGSSSDSSGW